MKDTNLHPTLKETVKAAGLNPARLAVELPTSKGEPDLTARDQVRISDEDKIAIWSVPSIRALFRGDRTPPSMAGAPPPEYEPFFDYIEQNVLHFCDAMGDKTDGEFEEAYSNLRRRPDGKSMSFLHLFLWQTAALLVGTTPLSSVEFDAIFGRLAQSARTFRMGPVSRNYIDALRQTR